MGHYGGDATIKAGDRTTIVTFDGKMRRFRIQGCGPEQDLVKAGDGDIRIEDILALEMREFSLGRTIAFIVGSIVLVEAVVIGNAPNAMMSRF